MCRTPGLSPVAYPEKYRLVGRLQGKRGLSLPTLKRSGRLPVSSKREGWGPREPRVPESY